VTTGQVVTLEDMERDALTELVNIGVSRAAVSLRKMVGQQVLLSVPSLEVVTRSGAITLIRNTANWSPFARISMVSSPAARC
jgi:chemotaxis protein CheC